MGSERQSIPVVCTAIVLFERAWPLFEREMTQAVPSSFQLNNGRACVYIGPYKPSRFKNNTFIL